MMINTGPRAATTAAMVRMTFRAFVHVVELIHEFLNVADNIPDNRHQHSPKEMAFLNWDLRMVS